MLSTKFKSNEQEQKAPVLNYKFFRQVGDDATRDIVLPTVIQKKIARNLSDANILDLRGSCRSARDTFHAYGPMDLVLLSRYYVLQKLLEFSQTIRGLMRFNELNVLLEGYHIDIFVLVAINMSIGTVGLLNKIHIPYLKSFLMTLAGIISASHISVLILGSKFASITNELNAVSRIDDYYLSGDGAEVKRKFFESPSMIRVSVNRMIELRLLTARVISAIRNNAEFIRDRHERLVEIKAEYAKQFPEDKFPPDTLMSKYSEQDLAIEAWFKELKVQAQENIDTSSMQPS